MMYMEKEAYPKPLVRVTGGKGGEAVLIVGSEKTALHDCGMACFRKDLWIMCCCLIHIMTTWAHCRMS